LVAHSFTPLSISRVVFTDLTLFSRTHFDLTFDAVVRQFGQPAATQLSISRRDHLTSELR
jgi:hypothetical protein